MGRASVKKNKNIYFKAREELNLSRDQASELLETIPPEKIERIENERCSPSPYEVLTMAKGYKKPELCNYFCSNECPIGMEYVPEITQKELSQIILQMVASLNDMKKRQERLIEISADGEIDDLELEDFVSIQKSLEKISLSVETLQLWAEKMIATGKINNDKYKKLISKDNI